MDIILAILNLMVIVSGVDKMTNHVTIENHDGYEFTISPEMHTVFITRPDGKRLALVNSDFDKISGWR